jgi:signal transduction histidine kinase
MNHVMGTALHASYSPLLVLLSVAVAVGASYTALELTHRTSQAVGGARRLWLAGGMALMGLGIWSMHFIGMLAFHTGLEVSYDAGLTFGSLAIAVAASGLALGIASRPSLSLTRLLVGGTAMGLAVAAMHHVGMAAMRLPGIVLHHPVLVALSVAIGIGASIAALWLAFCLRGEGAAVWGWRKLGSAVVMGVGMAGMHYTGMAALTVIPSDVTMAGTTLSLSVTELDAVVLGFSALFVLAVGLLGSFKEHLHAQLAEANARLAEANAQLRAADRHKDEFLSVISHELRTPLNFIMGFASVLDDEVAGELNAQQRAFVGNILSGSDRMLGLVNDLLDVAKIQAGRFELCAHPTPYWPLLEEVLATLRPLADQRGLTLTALVETEVAPPMDGSRIVQVLTNLVGNAIKFTPPGGRVTLRAFVRDEELVTQVMDTGVGIDAADVPKLFQRFSQLDMSATRQSGGTGLGLSISKALVEAHGGQIGVLSEVGHGSTFWFTLPLGAVAQTPTAPALSADESA